VTSLATSSYHAYRPEMGQPVRISLGVPRFKLSWELPPNPLWELTPRGRYFHAEPAEFAREYRAQLDRYGTARLHEIFTALATGDRLLLLCFERSGADCHRRLFSQWWLEHTGEIIPEVGGHL
jgi:Protein of unknown function, DUF488